MPRTLTHAAPHLHRRPVLSVLASAYELWRQRQALKRLDDAALRDIGLTRKDALAESRRFFWDAPQNWLK